MQNHSTFFCFYRIILLYQTNARYGGAEMSNIERLQKLRNIAILTKNPIQFGLTRLLISLEYGTEHEDVQNKDKKMELEIIA